jgi:hypothetical protein
VSDTPAEESPAPDTGIVVGTLAVCGLGAKPVRRFLRRNL